MIEKEIKTNSLMAWFLASRPKTLTAAAVPVLIGVSFGIRKLLSFHVGIENGYLIPRDYLYTGQEKILLGDNEGFSWLAALLCLLFAWVMQIDSNFINDYFDNKKGADDKFRLGPKRACAEGWVTMKAMKTAIILTSLLGCAIGLPLVCYGGWEMVGVGAACLLFCFMYTTVFSYQGMGDLLVVVFFGIVPVCCTYYVCMPEALQMPTDEVFWGAIACGLVVDTLLVLNNFRDRENDKRVDKRTLVVRIGARKSAKLYLYLGIVGAGLMSIVNIVDFVKNKMYLPAFLLFGVYCYFHYKSYRKMVEIQRGKKLNMVLGMTSRNILIFGIISLITILLVIPFLQYPVVNYD